MPIHVKPPGIVLPAWNEEPARCGGCGIELRGCYYDHPKGFFCGMECAGEAVKRPVTYRQAVQNDPFLTLREAMRGAH